jgi:general secretion pathway protein D
MSRSRHFGISLLVSGLVVILWGASLSPNLHAQDNGQGVRLSFPTGDLHLILMQYEELTGKKMILDNAVEGGKVLIDTTGYLSREQAIQFIEQSMLLNGYAIVPSGEGIVKVVAFESGKQPRNEGIRVFSDPMALPTTDEVITFVMPLSYLSPEDAVAALQQIAPGHPYGSITPLANAQALIITENSVTIRTYLDLMESIDVQPGTTEQRAFPLQRADAEEVVEALKELLGLDDAESGSSGARPTPANNRTSNPTPAPAANGGALPPPAAPQNAQAGASVGSTGDKTGSSPAPKIFAVLRTNRVLVTATPYDMARIELLVQELDAPADSRRFLSIPLRYVSVLGVLDALRSALLSGAKSDESSADSAGAAGAGGVGGALRPQLSGGLNSGGGSSGFGSSFSGGGSRSGFGSNSGFGGGSGFGSGSGGGGGGGSGFGASSGGGANQAPLSVIVGKTLIIADPVSNELFVSGPPDHLETIEELVGQLDRKPRQVIISAVIGQLTLGNDMEAGVDYFRTLESQMAGSGRFRGGVTSGATPDIRDLSDFKDLAAATTGGFSLYGLIGNRLSTYLTLLENSSRFKVLSNPTVFTLNNVPATISTGQRIAVPSNTLTTAGTTAGQNASVSATVQYEEVLLEINVIPLINSEDEVTLQIEQKNDDVGDRTLIGGNLVPNITTQALTTTVVVPNRSSVLLGGLITERDRENGSGLPFLSRIPLARLAFGSTRLEKDRSELLVFLQPTIVDSPQMAPAVGAEVAQNAALSAAIPTFPQVADPATRNFASGGGKIPVWKRVFGKKTTATPPRPVPVVVPAAPPASEEIELADPTAPPGP